MRVYVMVGLIPLPMKDHLDELFLIVSFTHLHVYNLEKVSADLNMVCCTKKKSYV